MSRFFCACFWPSRPKIPEEYLRPQGLYSLERVDLKKLRRLIRNQQLAPCHPGIEEPNQGQDLEECPICFLHYPILNNSLCCQKRVCTECFLQVQTSTPPHQLSACPFCKVLRPTGYLVKLIGARTAEEREQERLEEQKVIEARIREREEEVRRDQERALQRAHQQQQQQQQQQNAAAAVAGVVAAAAAAASPLDSSAATAGALPASRSPRPRAGTAGLPAAATQSIDHYQSPRQSQSTGIGPSAAPTQRNTGHLSAAGASDAATAGASQARGTGRMAAAGSSGGSAPGAQPHRQQQHAMEPFQLEGRVQQSARAAQQQQKQQRGSYPGSGFNGQQQQQVYTGGRFGGAYEISGGAGGVGVPAALVEEPQEQQQQPPHHRRRQSGGRRYRLTDYVPAGVVDIAMGLDDINDLMLEQAMYESIVASASAAQPAPAAQLQTTADAAAVPNEGSQYDAELAAALAASVTSGGGARGADGEQSGAHHNHHQTVRQQQQGGQHQRQHGATERDQRSHPTHTALQHRPAGAASRSVPVTPRSAAPATSVFTFAAASALHGPNAAAAAAAQGMGRNGAGRRPNPTPNNMSTMGGEAPSLATTASPQALRPQSPQGGRAACQEAAQSAASPGGSSAGAVQAPAAAARPLSPVQHSRSGRGGAGGSMEGELRKPSGDLNSGLDGAGGVVTRSGATVDGSRSAQHQQAEEEEALVSRRVAGSPSPAPAASCLLSISAVATPTATAVPVSESPKASDTRTAHGAARDDVSPPEPAVQPAAFTTVVSPAGPVAERHLTNPLYEMWSCSNSAANISTLAVMAVPPLVACKYLSGDVARASAEPGPDAGGEVTPPPAASAAAADIHVSSTSHCGEKHIPYNGSGGVDVGGDGCHEAEAAAPDTPAIGGAQPEDTADGAGVASNSHQPTDGTDAIGDNPASVITTDMSTVAESAEPDTATPGTTAVTLQSLAVELLRHSAGPHADSAAAARRSLSPSSSSSSSREPTEQHKHVVVVGMVFFSRGDGAGTSISAHSSTNVQPSPLAVSASPAGGSRLGNPVDARQAAVSSEGASTSAPELQCGEQFVASPASATVSYPIPGQPAWVENPDGSLQILLPPAQSDGSKDQPTATTGQGQDTQCDDDSDAILNMPYTDYEVSEADGRDVAATTGSAWRHEASDAALVARIALNDETVVAAVAAGDTVVMTAVRDGDRR